MHIFFQAADKEALNLLKWLATSQAAEDINSDDELIRETILSPLLPATTIDKVLEKANMDYESASQKECQDILDSIDDLLELESSKKKLPLPSNLEHSIEFSSDNMIPQVDGSGDEEFSRPCASSAGISFQVDKKIESKRASEYHVLQNANTSTSSRENRNKLWGSLPFSMTHNNVEHGCLHVAHPFECGTRDSVGSDYLTRNDIENSACDIKNADKDASDLKEERTLVNCSLRDLMRRKRCYRVEQVDSESGIIKKLFLERDEKQNICLWQKQMDLKTQKTDEGETEVQKDHDLKMSNHDYLLHGKLPLVGGSDSSLQASLLKDEHFGQSKMDGLKARTELINSSDGDPSFICTGPGLYKPKKSHSTCSTDYSEASSGKKFNVGPTYVQTAASDASAKKFDPFFDVQQLITDAEHKVGAPDSCQQIDSAALSSVQSSSIENAVSRKDNCIYKCSHESKSYEQHGQMEFYENAVGMNSASEMQVLQCVKNDEKKPREKLGFCKTIGSEPIVDDMVDNHMKLTIDRTPPVADRNPESDPFLPTVSNSHLHFCDELSGCTSILLVTDICNLSFFVRQSWDLISFLLLITKSFIMLFYVLSVSLYLFVCGEYKLSF